MAVAVLMATPNGDLTHDEVAVTFPIGSSTKKAGNAASQDLDITTPTNTLSGFPTESGGVGVPSREACLRVMTCIQSWRMMHWPKRSRRH